MSLFTAEQAESIASLGEVELIRKIRDWLGEASPPAPEGIGDDCAVLDINQSGKVVITTASISYAQHFDDSVSPIDAGAKLIKRNLSDIAAMGATPGPAVLALLCGPDVSTVWLEAFFVGIRETCLEYNVQLVGGDISSLAAGNFSAVLTLNGATPHPTLRDTAKIGDHIMVTGELGGSILGKHYAFQPRLEEGRWLAQQAACSSMMDLTDGLGKDLQAVLPKERSASLDLTAVPISACARELSETTGKPAIEHAFCDGEDYELLFTVDQSTALEDFVDQWRQNFPMIPLTKIGKIATGHTSVFIDQASNNPIPWTKGFEHLKTQ